MHSIKWLLLLTEFFLPTNLDTSTFFYMKKFVILIISMCKCNQCQNKNKCKSQNLSLMYALAATRWFSVVDGSKSLISLIFKALKARLNIPVAFKGEWYFLMKLPWLIFIGQSQALQLQVQQGALLWMSRVISWCHLNACRGRWA